MELGRYRLDEQVGQGGMAVVWRGWDTQLRRTVAVKVLHPHLHAREDIRKRFDREAHAVARLHHPHILDVYDFSGDATGQSWLVTEFIRGHTLRAFAEAHPFDPPELAAACLLPIAEALEHAHAAGVVHRDLKPENVMVRDDGVIKLTDFGIAALLEPDEKFTATGSILGSPAHLAPETIEGKPADPRSDLFSFGTILYWLSCGQLPFHGSSPAALLRNILEGKRQDPRAIQPSISDAQARLIARCLETDPAKRYQSASEVRRDLQQLLQDAGMGAPLAELAAFVQRPEEEARALRARLVERSLRAGEEQLAAGKTGAALSLFGRALSLDPLNEAARGRVDAIRRREKRRKLLRAGALLIACAALLVFGGLRAREALRSRAGQRQAEARAQGAARDSAQTPSRDPAQASGAQSSLRDAAQPGSRDAAQATAAQTPWRDASRTTAAQTLSRDPAHTNAAQTSSRDAAQTNAARPAAPRTREPEPPPAPKEPDRRVARSEKIAIKLHARFGAQVTIDGQDLGNDNMFSLQLAPGAHRVLVHHPCCADADQDLVVTPSRPDQLYQLRYGSPLPAQFHIVGAPADARVLVDGVLVGTAADPRPWAMTQPDQRATVTIGDRTLVATLKAGMVNALDYAQAAP